MPMLIAFDLSIGVFCHVLIVFFLYIELALKVLQDLIDKNDRSTHQGDRLPFCMIQWLDAEKAA